VAAQLVVDAGQDQFVVSGNPPTPVTLTGQVRENGSLVYGLAVQWSKLSGPGEFTTTDANRAITTAYFSLPGVYNLRLTATDRPPVPNWISPMNGSSYRQNVSLSATATDDVRVRIMEFYLDGALLISIPGVTTLSYGINLKPSKYAVGAHTLMVKACDGMNLCSDQSITIYKVR
jgi:hypothetical protein